MELDYRVRFADWKRDQTRLVSLRTEVFVKEQKVPVELEVDEMDPHSRHVVAVTVEDHLIGTARLLPDCFIGRMCVIRSWRGRGVGSAMLEFLIAYAREQGMPELRLNAQLSALPFYLRHGFVPQGEIFVEAGIDHQQMILKPLK